MIRNLKIQSQRYEGELINLTCEMLDHATGEWYRQDLTVTPSTAFSRLSDWNAKYDLPETHAFMDWQINDILAQQARYGCGF